MSKGQGRCPRCGGVHGSASSGGDAVGAALVTGLLAAARGLSVLFSNTRRPQEKRTRIQVEEEEEINQTPEISFALINFCSVNNKRDRASELITKYNRDVLIITETFLTHEIADTVLSKASPKGYSHHYQVRADGSARGGVAILFSERLQGEQLHFNHLNITTFEFVVTKLRQIGQDVAIIALYHPPGYNKEQFGTFMGEFKLLLSEVQEKCSQVIVAGDFNMPEGKGEMCYTDGFNMYMMTKCRWENDYVEEPTRGKNILDEVYGINVEISDLKVQDAKISDHSTVYFNAKPKDTGKKTEADDNEDRKRFKKTKE